MISKRFEDIDFSDLEGLLNNQVAEGKTIEYKKEIVTNASSDKDPFLAGVSAFANTNGGDFIIGIEAKDGIPTKLSGANFTNADVEILKLEQMLQTGIEPRIPSIDIKDIQSPTGENFILVRVNKSWIAPHKVKANEKFYGRNSKGKYPLDVSELRTAFMLTEQLSERIKNFRLERVRKIQENDELPVELVEGGKLVLHLVPLSAFATSTNVDIQKILKERNLAVIANSWSHKINLDGVLAYARSRDKNEAYTQMFRNGSIESTYIFYSPIDEKRYISSAYIEKELLQILEKFLTLFSELNIDTPIYLFLTLIDVRDYLFIVDSEWMWNIGDNKLDRNNLLLPEIVITNYEIKSSDILRPLFDMIWNAYGYPKCENYDQNGDWKPRS